MVVEKRELAAVWTHQNWSYFWCLHSGQGNNIASLASMQLYFVDSGHPPYLWAVADVEHIALLQ